MSEGNQWQRRKPIYGKEAPHLAEGYPLPAHTTQHLGRMTTNGANWPLEQAPCLITTQQQHTRCAMQQQSNA